MKQWRPEKNWLNPYHKDYDPEYYDVHSAYEAGADAMLKALIEEGINGKLWLKILPDVVIKTPDKYALPFRAERITRAH